jgi:small subunit ribosomal protein S16
VAVKIRLKRLGRKKKPVYRLVVAEQLMPRDGYVIEEIGFYDPKPQTKIFDYKKERVDYWLSVGAKPTDAVFRLFGEAGVLPKIKKVPKNPGLSKKAKKEQAESTKD